MRRFCRIDITHLVRSDDERLMAAMQAWIVPRIEQFKDAAMEHARELVAAERKPKRKGKKRRTR